MLSTAYAQSPPGSVSGAPALSVVIATTQPWPALQAALDAAYPQARVAGAEILIADGHGAGAPADSSRYPGVSWLRAPGRSVFSLRALAISQARAPIIAITEDHCVVGRDWCAQILRAHAEHPEAAAIGGAVENGAVDRMIDWAAFFIVNGPYLPPLSRNERKRIALQANVSYKREALVGIDSGFGLVDMFHHRMLGTRGEQLLADDRIIVEHVQSLGLRDTCAIHFHNGRSIGGFRTRSLSIPMRALRAAGCAALPVLMSWRTTRAVLAKRRYRARLLASLPCVAMLLCCHAAGELAGYVAGAGRSPERLQ